MWTVLLMGCGSILGPDELDLSKTDRFAVVKIGKIKDYDFFPLQTGLHMQYQVVHKDPEATEWENLVNEKFLRDFTISILGKQEIEGKEYYAVLNYRMPGRALPDTIFMRKDNNRIFAKLPNQEEFLLYSFTMEETTWGGEPLGHNKAERTLLSGKSAAISWDLDKFPGPNPFVTGPEESGWGEVFNQGKGRVRMAYFGPFTVVWDLTAIIASN